MKQTKKKQHCKTLKLIYEKITFRSKTQHYGHLKYIYTYLKIIQYLIETTTEFKFDLTIYMNRHTK